MFRLHVQFGQREAQAIPLLTFRITEISRNMRQGHVRNLEVIISSWQWYKHIAIMISKPVHIPSHKQPLLPTFGSPTRPDQKRVPARIGTARSYWNLERSTS